MRFETCRSQGCVLLLLEENERIWQSRSVLNITRVAKFLDIDFVEYNGIKVALIMFRKMKVGHRWKAKLWFIKVADIKWQETFALLLWPSACIKIGFVTQAEDSRRSAI